MTKEERREYSKAYRAKNKEKKAAYMKAYYDANKKEMRAQQNAYKAATETLYTVVYLLPNEHYVGISNNLVRRLRKHKFLGRDTSDHRILAELDSKEDALELEDLLHQEGYNGAWGWQREKK